MTVGTLATTNFLCRFRCSWGEEATVKVSAIFLMSQLAETTVNVLVFLFDWSRTHVVAATKMLPCYRGVVDDTMLELHGPES